MPADKVVLKLLNFSSPRAWSSTPKIPVGRPPFPGPFCWCLNHYSHQMEPETTKQPNNRPFQVVCPAASEMNRPETCQAFAQVGGRPCTGPSWEGGRRWWSTCCPRGLGAKATTPTMTRLSTLPHGAGSPIALQYWTIHARSPLPPSRQDRSKSGFHAGVPRPIPAMTENTRGLHAFRVPCGVPENPRLHSGGGLPPQILVIAGKGGG